MGAKILARPIVRDTRGATAAEYVLMVALVAMAALGAFAALGGSVDEQVDCAAGAIGGAGGPCRAGPGGPAAGGRVDALAGRDGDGVGGRTSTLAAGDGATTGGTAGTDGPSGDRVGGDRVGGDGSGGGGSGGDGDGDGADGPGTSATSSSSSALTFGPPIPVAPLSPEEQYQESLAHAISVLDSNFGEISSDDERITEEDLSNARSSSDAEVRAAAERLLSDPAALHALDLGAGGGDVDGKISEEDIDGFAATVREGGDALRDALADTAAGEGGRDGNESREDLEALANDESVPESMREWARERIANDDYDHGDCGFLGTSCAWDAVTGAADWTWDHTGGWVWEHTEGAREWVGDAAVWTASLGQKMTWMVGIPVVLPGQFDDYLEFRANVGRGMLDWGIGTVKGVYGVGKFLVERQIDSWSALAHGDVMGFLEVQSGVDLIKQAPKLWDAGTAIVTGLAHQIDACATGDAEASGRACGSLAMDVASVVIPGALAAKGARGAAIAADLTEEGRAAGLAGRTGELATAAERGALALSDDAARELATQTPRALGRIAEGATGDARVLALANVERRLGSFDAMLRDFHPAPESGLYHTAEHSSLAGRTAYSVERGVGTSMDDVVAVAEDGFVHDFHVRPFGDPPAVDATLEALEADFRGTRPLVEGYQGSVLQGELGWDAQRLAEARIRIKATDYHPDPAVLAQKHAELEQMLRDYMHEYFPNDAAAGAERAGDLLSQGARLAEIADKGSFYFNGGPLKLVDIQRGLGTEIHLNPRLLKGGDFLGRLATEEAYAPYQQIAENLGITNFRPVLRDEALRYIGPEAPTLFERNLAVARAIDAMPEGLSYDEAAARALAMDARLYPPRGTYPYHHPPPP